MSKFEIFLIVMLCAIPFISMFSILPKIKFKKKSKKVKKEPHKQEIKVEEKPVQEVKPVEKPKEVTSFASNDISTSDFKSYLDRKKQDISKPKRVELPSDFNDLSMPFVPRRRRVNTKPKSVSEEIKGLSPELKAMLIAGVLDKKNYD